MKSVVLTLIGILIYAPGSYSQSISLETVYQKGSGCFSENTHVSYNAESIKISFDSFVTTLDPYDASSVVMADCKWLAKIRAPEGYALKVQGGIFRGTYTQSEQAKTTFHSEIILDDRENDAGSFMLKGDRSASFVHDSSKYVRAMVGNCSGQSTLKFTSTMFIRSSLDERKYNSEARLTDLEIPITLVKCIK
jgi:Domain of unknown function (DUF4360)